MKVRIKVWRDDHGKMQPSQYVNDETAVSFKLGVAGSKFTPPRDPFGYATVCITKAGEKAYSLAIRRGEVRPV